jgi:PilZ domain
MSNQAEKRRNARAPVTHSVYYSDGAFHATGVTKDLTSGGGCLRGTHLVKVGMELLILMFPRDQRALLIKKATVRWVTDSEFGVELSEGDCGPVGELTDEALERQQGPVSFMTH